jgi:hypothetical protein
MMNFTRNHPSWHFLLRAEETPRLLASLEEAIAQGLGE